MEQSLCHEDVTTMDMETFAPMRRRGTSTPLNNKKLTLREMDSLYAICDTFLPSICDVRQIDDSVQTFFFTSASMLDIPETVGVFLGNKLKHPMLWLMRLGLWMLSTWYGTLAMCGWKSMKWRFPYFRKFSDVELHKREEILLCWSQSSFFLYRMLFKALKFMILLFYFTQVDEENQNPTWKALGYCGPDPDFPTPKTPHPDFHSKLKSGSDHDLRSLFGPLHGSLLYLHHPKDTITAKLSCAGLALSTGTHRSSLPTIRCDVVIVGSGSGGGVMAGILATSGYKVVVVEKGSHMSRNSLSLLEGHAMDSMYEGNGLLATSDVGMVVLAGSTVGGGSQINWAASLRTPEHVLREWSRDYDLELFDSQLYREAMDAVCDRINAHVDTTVPHEGLSNAALRHGCQELGLPIMNIPRNCTGDHDCGWCCFGCKDGSKKGTSETWLADAVSSGNAVVIPECEAMHVLMSKVKGGKRRVAGGVVVECSRDRRRYAVESKVTVVACGALNTPGFLGRSGLRNGSIGRNLHMHPVVMGWGTFPEGWGRKSYEGAIMTAMSGGGEIVIQTPALHPGMFSALMPWMAAGDFKERMCKYSRTAHVFALVRDRGKGRVETPGRVKYKLDRRDEEELQRGLQKVLRILAAAGAEEIGTHHCEGPKLNVNTVSSHTFEQFVREQSRKQLRDLSTPLCSAHQMGSCRMGVDPSTSAVGPTGETWEVERLYVADTSVFPTALGVNPMVTVQSIAYCTAQSVLHVLRRSRTGY